MANLDTDAIETRIRAVLLSGAGTLRTIASGTYLGDYHAGLSAEEKATRVIVKPRIDVIVRSRGRSPASPPSWHSLVIYDVEAEILVARALTFTEATSDARRTDATALASNDFDVISQALTCANLTGVALASNMMTADGGPSWTTNLTPDGDRPGLLETKMTFVGKVPVTQAVA